MLKPPMPNAAGMPDTLEFVKNLWGGMNIPGVGMPGMAASSLSVDDLDKRIADLKAVESWLNLNLGMLRGTIHTLEVQRGTLATLKAMGDSMAQAMQRAGSDPAMAAPFTQFFAQAAAPTPPAPAPSPKADQAQKTDKAGASSDQAPPTAQSAASTAMPAAVAWWNLLQDQFRQAVSSAMPAAGASPEAPGGRKDEAAKPGPAQAKARGGSPLDASGGAEPAPPGGPGGGSGGTSGSASGRVGRNPRARTDKG